MSGIGSISETPAPINLYVGNIAPWASASAVTLVANDAYYSAFAVERPVTVTTVRFVVNVASGNLCLGVFGSDATGAPGARLATTGSFACPAAGARLQALLAPVTLLPGIKYFIGHGQDNATATLNGALGGGGASGAVGMLYLNNGTFPLPDPAVATAAPASRYAGVWLT